MVSINEGHYQKLKNNVRMFGPLGQKCTYGQKYQINARKIESQNAAYLGLIPKIH